MIDILNISPKSCSERLHLPNRGSIYFSWNPTRMVQPDPSTLRAHTNCIWMGALTHTNCQLKDWTGRRP
jgi:hypothetical protein